MESALAQSSPPQQRPAPECVALPKHANRARSNTSRRLDPAGKHRSKAAAAFCRQRSHCDAPRLASASSKRAPCFFRSSIARPSRITRARRRWCAHITRAAGEHAVRRKPHSSSASIGRVTSDATMAARMSMGTVMTGTRHAHSSSAGSHQQEGSPNQSCVGGAMHCAAFVRRPLPGWTSQHCCSSTVSDAVSDATVAAASSAASFAA